MSSHPSFETLDRALIAFRDDRQQEALALAESAYRMVQEVPGAPPQASLVESWYGYMLATVGGRLKDGLLVCREASRRAFWEPRVFEHIARLEIEAGNRHRAVQAVRKGLTLSPSDPDLCAIRSWLGHRGKPAVTFLSRDHPINVALGKMKRRDD